MPIVVQCQSCETQLRVDDQHAGKKIRCPKCLDVVAVPGVHTPDPPQRRPPATPVSEPAKRPAPRPPARTESRRPQPARPEPTRPAPDPSRYTTPDAGPWKILAGAALGVLLIGGGGLFLVDKLVNRNSDETAVAQNADPLSEAAGTNSDNAPSSTNGTTAESTPGIGQSNSDSSGGNSAVAGITANASDVTPTTPFPSTNAEPSVAASSTIPAPSEMTSPNSGAAVQNGSVPTTSLTPPPTTSDTGFLTPSTTELPIPELFARVKPAVVRVNVSSLGGVGHGSGFVLNTSGIVVTNYHVIAGGTRAWIEFSDNERVEIDGVLYMNHQKDIAVLKFDPSRCNQQLLAIPLAQNMPAQGTECVAIGAPLGLDMSITQGVVSAIRTSKALEEEIHLMGHAGTWIQTDAEISPGNSGGPLLNRKGEVLGINTMTYKERNAQALNFAMSCDDIRQGLSELEEVPIVLSPLIAPPRDMENNIDRERQEDILDVSDTLDGKKRLAALKKIRVAYVTSRSSDPYEVVSGTIRSEVNDILERLKIEESLISNEVAVMLVAVRIDRAGDKSSVYITSHIIAVDESSGGQQALKLWERTGKAGTTTTAALRSGKLATTLQKDLKEFFTKLRTDVQNARKEVAAAAASGANSSDKNGK